MKQLLLTIIVSILVVEGLNAFGIKLFSNFINYISDSIKLSRKERRARYAEMLKAEQDCIDKLYNSPTNGIGW